MRIRLGRTMRWEGRWSRWAIWRRDTGAGAFQTGSAGYPTDAHRASFGLCQSGANGRSCTGTGRVPKAEGVEQEVRRTVMAVRVLGTVFVVAAAGAGAVPGLRQLPPRAPSGRTVPRWHTSKRF